MNRIINLLILFLSLCVFLSSYWFIKKNKIKTKTINTQKKQLEIHFLNTSGEIAVLNTGKKIFLIDAGFIISPETFKKNTTIEAIFLSHPHIDMYHV